MRIRHWAVENLEERDLLTTVFVSSDADSGSGSLREAIEAANADSEIDRIAFMSLVETVEIASSLEYTGSQDLTLYARGATLKPAEEMVETFDLFVSSGDANLRIRDMVFEGGAYGIYAPISETATGTVQFQFLQVTVQDNESFGIYLDDQLNSSEATLKLMMRDSFVLRNGYESSDFDGVRIDEGGDGSIHARIMNTAIEDNGGDGMRLGEENDGSVWMFTTASSFDRNGFFDDGDFEDGLDINETGSGNLWFRAAESTFNNNFEQGLDLDEEQEGFTRVHLFRVDANQNSAEGIKVDEKFDEEETGSDGNLVINFAHVNANLNLAGQGISVSEAGDGSLVSSLINVVANNNGAGGIQIEESGIGNLRNLFLRVETNSNGGSGVEVDESGLGRFIGLANIIESSENAGYGLELRQESGSETDWGRMNLGSTVFASNLDGVIDSEGVTVF